MRIPIPLFLHKFSSPRYFYDISGRFLPWLAGAFAALTVVALYIGFQVAPTHSEQGESYRIIFIHVPFASNSMMVYTFMAVSSLIFLVWRIKLADVMAEAAAPIGASFTFLALVTGSIWGKPTWGTWWQWDARLTSELVLLFLYLGYMALRAAIEDRQNAGRAAAVLAIVGVVNIPIIHYSVEWWNTLHQGATISQFAKPSMEGTMLTAMLMMMLSMGVFFGYTLLLRGRCTVLRNEIRSAWVKKLPPTRRGVLAWIILVLAVAGVLLHSLSNDKEIVLTPGQLSGAGQEDVRVMGRVTEIRDAGEDLQLTLTDPYADPGSTQLTVAFRGQPPRDLRSDWGARVEGRIGEDGVLRAERMEALNVRDHRGYLLAAYLIAVLVIGINFIQPHGCEREARKAIARRLRREEETQ